MSTIILDNILNFDNLGLLFTSELSNININPFLSIIPLIIVLALLFLKVDMIVAGLIGALFSVVVGGIEFSQLNAKMLESIPSMLNITIPIINSAIAMAVFKAGSYSASLELFKRITKGKVEYLSGFIVILLTAATYMSGIGGGSAMVIAPLAFAAVGVVPELIAGMSLAAAVSFTTSPASLESSVVSKLSGENLDMYVQIMRPYWIGFVILAVLIAFVGTKRKKMGFKEAENSKYSQMNNVTLLKYTSPAIFLLFAVIFGPVVNKLVNINLFTPLTYMVVTLILITICTDFNLNQSVISMIDGSNYILTRLFQVGIFLGFINVIAMTGTFEVIASVAKSVPTVITVPMAVLTGILIGIPAGAYVGSVLSLVLPVAISLGFSLQAIGLVTIGVGLGSQMSFVNITMQALSSGFQIPILEVVKGNVKWIGMVSVLLIGISFFV